MALRILPFLLLLPATLRAQSPGPVRDSAYAVHNLFRQRRGNALSEAGYGFAGLAGTAFAVSRGQGAVAGLLTLNALVSSVLAVRNLRRYSESREAGVVQQYEQGWPLPADVRKRLKIKYFRALK
ncbi:hypothetical protein Q5H92_15415 [Hymenobacter sp. M29]|uniref:DUF4133 domain-containing protein n=1 Tax=Hymenobacter mellowenesis TaxID=3063995 RepID=A0ABT9AD45_9BACT|nr:hypothetical protein [Hymenobacter sp. M29]MDO7847756.1 hypothetical protein [Hymenobacter sp. M29]